MGNSWIVTPKFCDLIKLSVETMMEQHQTDQKASLEISVVKLLFECI